MKYDQKCIENIKTKVVRECCKIRDRYAKYGRKSERFKKNEEKWLSHEILFKLDVEPNDPTGLGKHGKFCQTITIVIAHNYCVYIIAGRPSRSFDNCSMNTKRKKVSDLRKKEDTSVLSFATEMNLRADGKVAEANVLKTILHDSPGSANEMVKDRKIAKSEPIPYTSTDALALMIDTDLSRRGYQILRKQAIKRFSNIYPSYKRIQEAKQKCYPADINVTESKAEVSLQSMLDITTERIFGVISEDFSFPSSSHPIQYTLISKWGFDGSGSQSAYNQPFVSTTFNDSSLFMTSLVPLHLCTFALHCIRRLE